ncbi:MAG: hypothetical protein HY821_24145 [Acidobacteria bacterium]|nr:hypothetical protein [Acidobacteriota bacterium]
MAEPTSTLVPPISALVPFLHVADVERSALFYSHLGFRIGNRVPADGTIHWAWLYSPEAPEWRRGANLMLASAERPLPPDPAPVIFYLYASNLIALRNALLQAGLQPGDIRYPPYLPLGEFTISDPDGYRLIIAQSTPDTP